MRSSLFFATRAPRLAAALFLAALLTGPSAAGARQDPAQDVPPADAAQAPADADAADAEPEDDPAAAGDLPLEQDAVKRLQQELKDRGYFFGPVDGRKGPRTRTALRNFQRAEGMPATGSLDQETVDRLSGAAASTPVAAAPPQAAPPARSGSSGGGGGAGAFLGKVWGGTKRGVGAVVGAGKATGKAAGKAGAATGKAGAVTGEAVGKAGSVTAVASATAATASASAIKTAALAVADTTVGLVETGKRKVVGDRRTDDQIRRAIERQYSEDERLDPSEIEVRVADGNVTLALPQSPRSNVQHAVRLAKLTPGVKAVNTVYTAQPASVAGAETSGAPDAGRASGDAAPDELPQTVPAAEPGSPAPPR